MIHAAYALPDAEPQDGDAARPHPRLVLWCNHVMARAESYPEAAHLASFRWSDKPTDLDHDLQAILHDCDDPDLVAITTQVVAGPGHARRRDVLRYRRRAGRGRGIRAGRGVGRRAAGRGSVARAVRRLVHNEVRRAVPHAAPDSSGTGALAGLQAGRRRAPGHKAA